METQGIVIWAQSWSGALILWCADNGALVYVADRRSAGDQHDALSVGDIVDLHVEKVGAMRVGSDLRYRSTGARWVPTELGRRANAYAGPVVSPRQSMAQGMGFGSDAVGDARATTAANRARRTGAA